MFKSFFKCTYLLNYFQVSTDKLLVKYLKCFPLVTILLLAGCPEGGGSSLTTSRSTGDFTFPSSNEVNGFLDRSLSSPTGCTSSTPSRPAGSIRGEAQVRFNECSNEGGITARYFGNRSCGSSRKISKTFNSFLRTNLKSCVEAGTGKSVAHVNIIHAGIAGDTSHTSRSYHSMNRAIDIKSFEITFRNGTKKIVSSANQRAENSFFTNFANCWSQKVSRSGRNCPGSLPRGFIGREDPDHTRHIHISLPYCPRRSGVGSK